MQECNIEIATLEGIETDDWVHCSPYGAIGNDSCKELLIKINTQILK